MRFTVVQKGRLRRAAGGAVALAASALLAATAGGAALAGAPLAGGPTASSAEIPDTLRVANEASITSFDPVACGHTECRRFFNLTNGYLTEFGSGDPGLAESLVASDDNTTWTATLREGLAFSDGSPLTSDDVVATYQRYLEPPIEGTLEVFSTMESVEAPDPRTVVFTLSRPDAQFAKSIAFFQAAVYPADRVSDEDFFAAPVTAGRYRLVEGDMATGTFTLEPNPNYWGEPPKISTVVFTTVPDGATRLAQVLSGQVDYAKSIPANQLAGLPAEFRVERVGFPEGMIHLALNDDASSDSITTDVNIRRAIDLAVDREQIAAVALGGYMDPLYGVPWDDPDAYAPARPRDLDEARRLLEGTACADGCQMRFVNVTDFNWQLPLTSTIVQQNLSDIGIEVELVNTTLATATDALAAGWDGVVLDPGGNVNTEASIATAALTDWLWWPSTPEFPELIRLVDELAVAPLDAIPELQQEINDQFEADLPWIPLTTLTFLDVTRLPESAVSSPIGWVLNLP